MYIPWRQFIHKPINDSQSVKRTLSPPAYNRRSTLDIDMGEKSNSFQVRANHILDLVD